MRPILRQPVGANHLECPVNHTSHGCSGRCCQSQRCDAGKARGGAGRGREWGWGKEWGWGRDWGRMRAGERARDQGRDQARDQRGGQNTRCTPSIDLTGYLAIDALRTIIRPCIHLVPSSRARQPALVAGHRVRAFGNEHDAVARTGSPRVPVPLHLITPAGDRPPGFGLFADRIFSATVSRSIGHGRIRT